MQKAPYTMGRHVLLISPSFSFGKGGVENLMRRIRSESRHKFTVLTEDEARQPGDRSMQITRLRGAMRVTKFFLNHLHQYDAVYVSTARISHLLLFPWLVETATIIHAHGSDVFFDPSSWKTRLRFFLSRFLMSRVSRIIAVSEWTREQLLEEYDDQLEERVTLVPNGVDVERFRNGNGEGIREQFGIAEEEFLLCTVARLDPRKGHRFVLEALPDLPNCTYLIVGTGPHEDRLRKMIEKKNLKKRVVMAGFVSDDELPDVYDACDLFIMPSEHLEESNNVEGFGISFLEANAAGKAVIGTRTGGIPTAVQHEKTGLLCEPKASSVREAVARLQHDDSFRRYLEENALRWAQTHDWSKVIRRIDKVIDSTIEGNVD